MFVIEAAVGTWLLTKVLGRDAESGPVEEPTAELPAVPTPMPASRTSFPSLPITRPTHPVVSIRRPPPGVRPLPPSMQRFKPSLTTQVHKPLPTSTAVKPEHVWITPAVKTETFDPAAYSRMIDDIIHIDGKLVILITGRDKAIAEPTATDYALRLVIEQVKDALHARGRMSGDQIKMLMVLSDAAQKELEDRGAPLSGLSVGRGTRRRSRIGNGGIGSLKSWHKDRIMEGRSADLNAMNREITLIRMREGANIDTSRPVDTSGRVAVDHWKNHATREQIAQFAPIWAQVESKGIEISQEGHNVIIELLQLDQAQKKGLLAPKDVQTRGLLVLERVVEDILNNSKFVVGTYDVESGGFPDVKVQRLSGINGYDNYHNNLGSAFVKTRGVMGRLLGP